MGDEGAAGEGLVMEQWRRHWRVWSKLGVVRPTELYPVGDIEVGFGVGVVLVEPCQLAPAVAPRHVDHDRAVHDRQRQRADGGDRDRRKRREGAGLAAMVSGDLAAPAMSGIEHGAQRPVEGEAEVVGFVDQQGWMLAVNSRHWA